MHAASLQQQMKRRLLAMPPRAFELFAGDLLEYMGLQHVAVTRYTGDGGIDAHGRLEAADALLSIPIGVQVKRYRANIQRSDIDRFLGALQGSYSQGIFITTSGYSPQALLKARSAPTQVTTMDGDQVVGLMMRYSLGIRSETQQTSSLDEAYFQQFEQLATEGQRRIAERTEPYVTKRPSEQLVEAEQDLISLRALSHALRVDTSTLRDWIVAGKLHVDTPAGNPQGAYFFRRDRIERIRAELLIKERPQNTDAWRQDFLEFARSRNMTKSYKPVLLKILLKHVNPDGELAMDLLVQEFRAFYQARKQAGLMVEYGPPDPSDSQSLNDTQLRQLIVRHPLERFLIKGFLSYSAKDGVVRFAPQLWQELRAWELLQIQQSVDEQIEYYYGRAGA